MGATASHIDCPNTFNEYLNFNKSDSDQLTSLDSPGPSSVHLWARRRKRHRKHRHFPPNPLKKML
jgi:hypothetical protein